MEERRQHESGEQNRDLDERFLSGGRVDNAESIAEHHLLYQLLKDGQQRADQVNDEAAPTLPEYIDHRDGWFVLLIFFQLSYCLAVIHNALRHYLVSV